MWEMMTRRFFVNYICNSEISAQLNDFIRIETDYGTILSCPASILTVQSSAFCHEISSVQSLRATQRYKCIIIIGLSYNVAMNYTFLWFYIAFFVEFFVHERVKCLLITLLIHLGTFFHLK